MARLIDRLTKEITIRHDSNSSLQHKKTWLALTEKGVWPCQPRMIYNKFKELTSLDQFRPHGEGLLKLKSRDKFTLLPNGKPRRPEEALERLIDQSNPNNTFGQMPIMQVGRSTVDIIKIGKAHSTFIELKSWRSQDTPLFAIVENLKNLMLYRILKEDGHKGCSTIKDVNLTILAPLSYFYNHNIIDKDYNLYKQRELNNFLNATANIFRTRIKILALNWREEDLWDICTEIKPKYLSAKERVSVKGFPEIEALREASWIELYST